MAVTAMRKTTKMKEEKRKAAEAILKSASVDCICDLVNTAEKAKVKKEVEEILETGGFYVKYCWLSSSQASATEDPNEVVLGGESHVDKVLGTVWLPEKDTFTFKMKIELAK